MTSKAIPLQPTRAAIAAARRENFPVASRLLDRRRRPHVLRFYAFARAADDIADAPGLSVDEKLEHLAGFRHVLLNGSEAERAPEAAALRVTLSETGVTADHALALLRAFERDANRPRTADWAELMAYCTLSANPVGRIVLDLHGESAETHPASDALCSALQVLNHLQDCGADYRQLDRIYLPQDWLRREAVAEADLAAPAATPGLRRVLDGCLAKTGTLLAEAAPLPRLIANGRLALEAGIILRLARALARQLARRDPLARRVKIARPAMLALGLSAICREGFARVVR